LNYKRLHMVKPSAQQPSSTAPSPSKKRVGHATAAGVGAQIGAKLKAMFDGVLAEPVPDKFLMLLDELERKSSSKT
jgi:Anti-sigma factor NepR